MLVAEAAVVIIDGTPAVWFSPLLNFSTAFMTATVTRAFACCSALLSIEFEAFQERPSIASASFITAKAKGNPTPFTMVDIMGAL